MRLFHILIFKLFQLSFGLQEEADVIGDGDDITEVTALAPPPNSIRTVA